jgi:ATP-dependent RNA helicase DDX3X
MRLKIFGTATDHESVHSDINFDKYDNIPVETTGENIPEGIDKVKKKKKKSTCYFSY